jgi:hypothetical protein
MYIEGIRAGKAGKERKGKWWGKGNSGGRFKGLSPHFAIQSLRKHTSNIKVAQKYNIGLDSSTE